MAAGIWLTSQVSPTGSLHVQISQRPRPSPWTKEGTPDSGFGSWIAPAGDINGDGFADVLICAPNADRDRGQVFLFLGSAQGLSVESTWTAWGESPGSLFGSIAMGVGDINKDGFADLMIGAPYQRNGILERAGCAYLFLGSPNGLSAHPDWIYRGEEELVEVGGNVAPAGDVNGDGFADVTISAAHFRKAAAELGRVMVFYGSPQGLRNEPDWTQDGDQPSGNFGETTTCAGDVNHDGFDDLIVGTPHYDGDFMDEGKAFLFLGSATGLAHTAAWTARYDSSQRRSAGSPKQQLFANTVAAAGDVNHDGFDDVLVTAYFAEKDDRDEGMAFLYLGGRDGLSAKPAWTARSNQESALFGSFGAGIGDVNRDGFSDVIIGARQASHGELHEGGAFIFYGGSSGLERDPGWSAESDQALAGMGRNVAGAGDVNGDGYDDVLVNALEFSRNGQRVGKVWLHYGGPDGLTGSSGWNLRKPWFVVAVQRVNSFMSQRGWLVAWLGSVAMAGLVAGLWRLRRKRAESEQLASQRQRQLEEERSRISREIHDNLGSDLQHLAILSQTALEELNQSQPHERLVRINERAQQLAGTIREFIWVTNPRHDSLTQFADFISEYVLGFFEPTSVRCEVAIPNSLPSLVLPAHTRHELLLILKEACHNIVKHAQASFVRITVELEDQRLRLIVTDDGKGFDPNLPSGGNGLCNMRRRAAELGCQLKIASAPGQGVKVQIEVPLEAMPTRPRGKK